MHLHLHRGGDESYYTAPSTSALAALATVDLVGRENEKLSLRGDGVLRPDPLLRLELHRSAELGDDEMRALKKKWEKLLAKHSKRKIALQHRRQQQDIGGGGGAGPLP